MANSDFNGNSYTSAKRFMEQHPRKSRIANNTLIVERDDAIAIQLHGADVVTYLHDGCVILRSGGYETTTTKQRINQFSPVGVYQRNFEWFVADGIPFFDGMMVVNDGNQWRYYVPVFPEYRANSYRYNPNLRDAIGWRELTAE